MTTLQEAPYRSLYEVTGDIKDLNTMLVPRTALAQQGEQQPVCHGCGIPAGDVHMSTCKSGKWPSRVSNGDTAAPAPQVQECTRSHPHELMNGYCGLRTEIARLTNENARLEAAPQPASELVAGLNRSYTEQLINALHENSDPVSIDAAEEFQRLLASALVQQGATKNCPQPEICGSKECEFCRDTAAPQPAQWESLNLVREVLKLNALWNKSTVQAPEISDQLGICRVLAERVNTDD